MTATQTRNQLKLNAVRVGRVVYVEIYRACIDRYLFDGLPMEKSHKEGWQKLPTGIPVQAVELKSAERINPRFRLKDHSLASEKIPAEIAYDRAGKENWNGEFNWAPEYEPIQTLYETVYDELPKRQEPIDLVLNFLYQQEEDVPDPQPFSYATGHDYGRDRDLFVTNQHIQRQLLDEIQTPGVAHYAKPARFTSKETFDIIRAHVKAKIDERFAVVTSDYEFCFTVEKLVKLETPESYSIDVNYRPFSKRQRRPKYEQRMRTTRAAKVFEMTHSERRYEKYPVIEGFQAENEPALKLKIDRFLDDLMEFINRPAADCPHCHGCGVVFDQSFEMNARP